MGGLNYVVTIMNLRTKGMKMTRMPLTIWALLLTAVIGILSFPVLLERCLAVAHGSFLGHEFLPQRYPHRR